MNTSAKPSKWFGAAMNLSTTTAPLLLTLGLVCGGCATTIGTRPGGDPLVLSGIRTLGLSVRAEQDFEVRFAREGYSGVGLRSGGAAAVSLSAAGAGAAVVPGAAIVAAVIGDAIEAGVRSSKDQRPTQELRTQLGQFDSRDFVERTRLKNLVAAELVPSVERVGTGAGPNAAGPPVDAVFTVDIKQWGLRPCSPPQPGKEAQVGMLVNLEIRRTGDGKLLYERREIYLDADPCSLEELRSKPGLLVERLRIALDRFCRQTSNKLSFGNNQ